MIPWIQIYSNLITHPKTYALAESLNLSCASVDINIVAAGVLVGIWSWAAQNATDGNITHCPLRVIADAAGWKKKPDVLMAALIKSGWVDKSRDSLTLHDWEDYAQLLIEQMDNQRSKTKERVRRYREQKRLLGNAPLGDKSGEDETPRNDGGNVTETLCNASTLPYLTIPNYFVVDGDICAGGERNDFSQVFSLIPQDVKTKLTLFTEELFKRYTPRKPTQQDISLVFSTVSCIECAGGEWRLSCPKDETELLIYAFEQANAGGAAGNWNYITSVLERLSERGIATLESARIYDISRMGDSYDNR